MVLLKIKKWYLVFALFFLFQILLSNKPMYSDELFYFNISKLIKQGWIPYEDFFFAHPLVQVFLLSFFSSSLELLRFISILIGAGVIFLFNNISMKEFSKKNYLLFLSPFFLAFYHLGLGEILVLFFLFSTYFLLLKKNFFSASLFFSLAFFTRYISIFFLPLFFKKTNKSFFEGLVFFSSLLFSAHFLIGGIDFFKNTFFYHLDKFGFGFFDLKFYFFFNIFYISFLFLKKVDFRIKYLLFLDAVFLFLFSNSFITYFIISNAFILLFCVNTKKEFLPLFFISFLFLIPTITFYHEPNPIFEEMNVFFSEHAGSVVLGDPILVNYLNFSGFIRVYDNEFDSFSQGNLNISSKSDIDFLINPFESYGLNTSVIFFKEGHPDIIIFNVT